MFCAKCNLTYSGGSFCPTCGTSLIAPPSVTPAAPSVPFDSPTQPNVPAQPIGSPYASTGTAPGQIGGAQPANLFDKPTYATASKRANKNWIIWGAIAAVLVLAVVFGVSNNHSNQNTSNAAPSDSSSDTYSSTDNSTDYSNTGYGSDYYTFSDALDACFLSDSDTGVLLESSPPDLFIYDGDNSDLYSSDLECVLNELGAPSSLTNNILYSYDSGSDYIGDIYVFWNYDSKDSSVNIDFSIN